MTSRHSLAAVLLTAVTLLTGSLLTGCAERRGTPLSPDDTVRAAQLLLTEQCLIRQGLTPPRPGSTPPPEAERRQVVKALFGAGQTELRVRLPNGYVVRRHTDGCLASAQQRLYGDQPRWFKVSTTVDNLKSKAPRDDRLAYKALRARAVQNARALLGSTLLESPQATPIATERNHS
ncbi:hypothetical protein ACIBI4_31430 [Streptomyces sp. NPDC050418]|uniref:hypothetical protein n=1 Tax=Streptomyces sp. NPDC050418 TaxID=3365612 RepID=UPI0037AEAABC